MTRPLPCPHDAFSRVSAAAFGQRRKMLRSSLKGISPDSEKLARAAGIDPSQRAEQISVANAALDGLPSVEARLNEMEAQLASLSSTSRGYEISDISYQKSDCCQKRCCSCRWDQKWYIQLGAAYQSRERVPEAGPCPRRLPPGVQW